MKNLLSSLLLLLASVVLFSACKKEDEAPIQVTDIFVGTFAVAETSPTIGESDYDIVITRSATDKNSIEISNFADSINKKVKATVSGNTITIPEQIFNTSNAQIKITGTGTLNGTKLHFSYSVKGSYAWDATCVSTKK